LFQSSKFSVELDAGIQDGTTTIIWSKKGVCLQIAYD
jgi:hypothetical protein